MAIARHLNRDGIPTSTGAAKWTQASVRNVLVNPLYAGKVRHDGAVYPGTHEAIISEETFAPAQRVRATTAAARRTAKNAKGNYRGLPSGSNNGGGRAPRGSHLFTRGVLRCGPCGDAMAPRTHRRRTGPETDVYQCLGRYRDEDSCDQLPSSARRSTPR